MSPRSGPPALRERVRGEKVAVPRGTRRAVPMWGGGRPAGYGERPTRGGARLQWHLPTGRPVWMPPRLLCGGGKKGVASGGPCPRPGKDKTPSWPLTLTAAAPLRLHFSKRASVAGPLQSRVRV